MTNASSPVATVRQTCRLATDAGSYLRAPGAASLPALGKPLQAITLGDLQVWRSQRHRQGHHAKTSIAIVRSLFSFAVKVGFAHVAGRDDRRRHLHRQSAHGRVLTQRQHRTMVDACRRTRVCANTLSLLVWRGYQRGPCAALADDYASTMAAQSSISQKDTKDRGRRKRNRPQRLLRLRDEDTPDGRSSLPHMWTAGRRAVCAQNDQRVLRRAGLPDNASTHWLRPPSHATRLSRGGNVADLQAQLGHASLATTSTYAHAGRSLPTGLAI